MKKILQLIGSPFAPQAEGPAVDDETLLAIYDEAFVDRVALLYLEKYRRPGWAPELEQKYRYLEERRLMTLSVISTLAEHLDTLCPENYLVFKSVKPYPATPNDTDVLFLGNRKQYRQVYQQLLAAGYVFHEWAPQQKTVYDPRGAGKIGKGKKGGTYYIDLYEEVSTDYFAYLDKRALRPYIVQREINGVVVPLLRPEPELAIVLFHNVFPERTYQLEHFYLPLYTFAQPDFDLDVFIEFCERNHLWRAVRANLSLVAALHEFEFGNVPEPVAAVLARWGEDVVEKQRYQRGELKTPYLFSPRLFWQAFSGKLVEWYSLRTALWQLVNMLNPHFLMDVIGALRLRLGPKSPYNLE